MTKIEAVYKGNFKNIFGIDATYYILNNPKHSVVMTQRELGRVLKFAESGISSAIKDFAKTKTMANYRGGEILAKLENPLIFSGKSAGVIDRAYGFSVDILIDICNAVIEAKNDNKLLPKQMNIATQAQIIVNACAKSGITNIAYALAGYRPEIHEILEGFKRFLVEEIASAYEKTFPVELYLEWAKIYNFPLKAGKNFNVKCRWLTIDNVYRPLARSNGKILEMLKDKKASDIHGSNKKLFQYLNEEIGAVELKKHLSSLLTIAKLAKGNRAKYENDFAEIFGGQLQFDFDALDREDALNEVKNNKTTQEILKDYPNLFHQDNKDFDIVLNEIVKK